MSLKKIFSFSILFFMLAIYCKDPFKSLLSLLGSIILLLFLFFYFFYFIYFFFFLMLFISGVFLLLVYCTSFSSISKGFFLNPLFFLSIFFSFFFSFFSFSFSFFSFWLGFGIFFIFFFFLFFLLFIFFLGLNFMSSFRVFF